MKKLAKGLVLAMACLPLVSFSDDKCYQLKNSQRIEVFDGCNEYNRFRFIDKQSQKTGFINHEGNIVIPAKYDFATSFINGYAIVTRKNPSDNRVKFGVIDKLGKTIIPFEYEGIDFYYDGKTGFSIQRLNENNEVIVGFVDMQGKVVIEPKYDKVFYFINNISPITQHGKSGYVTATGKIITPLIYDKASVFDGGFGIVKLNGKYGYIKPDGTLLTPLQYDHAQPFIHNQAVVLVKNKAHFIDNHGQRITKDYDDLYSASNDYDIAEQLAFYIAKEKGKFGVIDETHQVKLPFEFDDIKFDTELSIFQVTKNGKIYKIPYPFATH